jgi:hypothetical protein
VEEVPWKRFEKVMTLIFAPTLIEELGAVGMLKFYRKRFFPSFSEWS